jgi:PBSX family phage portal protein
MDEERQAIFKALVLGAEIPASVPGGETDTSFAELGALVPPHDPEMLCRLFEHSNSLRPNVDAYATNIDGFGHRLDPAIDLEAENADERVAESLYLETLAAEEDKEHSSLEASPEEVANRVKALERLAQVEKSKLGAFFDSCCYDYSFVELRRRSRQDLEVTGNAYWEVLRNGKGDIARLVHVPSYTVRLMPLDSKPTEMTEQVRISPVTYEPTTIRRRLRRYVQVQDTTCVFFKELGDPRIISKNSGKEFKSVEALRENNPTDAPATEMLHFAVFSPRSPYGVPRWIGTLLSVLGSRAAEEVNYLYFENKSVPPLALLVSGGKLSKESIPRIERYIEENLKGKKNFHKILILEAEGSGSTHESKAKVELKPLTDAQQQDALFQDYDERNIDKVGASFRVPRLLRGESRDFNRSVADAQLRFAEDQVFQPERDSFDYMMNHRIFADMGIRFWRFRSQTPVTRDPERLTVMIEKLVRVGVLTPEEGRFLSEDVFKVPCVLRGPHLGGRRQGHPNPPQHRSRRYRGHDVDT